VKAAALLAAALAVAASGCESGRKAESRGLGPYRFGVTTRAQLKSGVCQPTELTDGRKAVWCFALPPIKVGKRNADVDAYFLGTDPPLLDENPTPEQRADRVAALEKLPLIELQLKVRGCVEGELAQWLREKLGPAAPESKGTRDYWHNSFYWAVAMMPSEPGRCIVHLLPTSETSEIERLKAL
jgi:hypothetical protein